MENTIEDIFRSCYIFIVENGRYLPNQKIVIKQVKSKVCQRKHFVEWMNVTSFCFQLQ